ncbi:class I SAM-dependent methyltransferase [Undibacterium sp. Ji49W]|uniref:class I SAM-dependent methyltransferase n=1 Tax=Undibacterium sp. Ji49W TaxID=3413040 RepID=UPI003BEF8C1E
MKLLEKASVQAFHRHRLGGSSLQALGFRGPESQTKRFETLCTWGDFSGCSILDLGCGYGDLKPFLDQRYNKLIYLGVDFLKEFVEAAQERLGHLPNTQFFQSDFLTTGLPEVDIVIASGSLNYRSENVLHPWQIISQMWKVAGKGVAFNLLDAEVFGQDEMLCGYIKDEVLTYCRKLDPQAELISGYLPDDFTILMRK